MKIYTGEVTFGYSIAAHDKYELKEKLAKYDYGFIIDYKIEQEMTRNEALSGEIQNKLDDIKKWVKELDHYKDFEDSTLKLSDKQYKQGIDNFMDQLDNIAQKYDLKEEYPRGVNGKLQQISDTFDDIEKTFDQIETELNELLDKMERPGPFKEGDKIVDKFFDQVDEFNAKVHKAVDEVAEDAK